jgi:translation initiation factor 2 subunit 2
MESLTNNIAIDATGTIDTVADTTDATDNNEIDDLNAMFSSKKKKAKKPAAEQPKKQTEQLYPYDELLARVYAQMGDAETKKRVSVAQPKVSRLGTIRTCINNFRLISKQIERAEDHMCLFIQIEFGTTIAIDSATGLVKIKGRFSQEQIETVISKYIRDYVLCKQCKSDNTILERREGLTFLKCFNCRSTATVTTIRAVTKAKPNGDQ